MLIIIASTESILCVSIVLSNSFVIISLCLPYHAGAQTVKRLPTVQETWVQSLGQENPLEKEMTTHSSILAWKIPWTKEPGRLQSTGRKESDMTERLHFLSFFLHFIICLFKVKYGLIYILNFWNTFIYSLIFFSNHLPNVYHEPERYLPFHNGTYNLIRRTDIYPPVICVMNAYTKCYRN